MDDYDERKALIEELERFGMDRIDWSETDTQELRTTLERVKERRKRGTGHRKYGGDAA